MCVGVSVNILTPFIFLLQVLQTELSVLKHNQPRIHELSTYLMLSDVDEISRVTKSHLGSKATDDQARLDLMHRLQVQSFMKIYDLSHMEEGAVGVKCVMDYGLL